MSPTNKKPVTFRRDRRAGHEQRLDHLHAGTEQREEEQEPDAKAIRPQPPQVFAEIRAAFGLLLRIVLRRVGLGLLVLDLGRFVDAAELVVLDKMPVSLPR
jgi:hypothetical protein